MFTVLSGSLPPVGILKFPKSVDMFRCMCPGVLSSGRGGGSPHPVQTHSTLLGGQGAVCRLRAYLGADAWSGCLGYASPAFKKKGSSGLFETPVRARWKEKKSTPSRRVECNSTPSHWMTSKLQGVSRRTSVPTINDTRNTIDDRLRREFSHQRTPRFDLQVHFLARVLILETCRLAWRLV